MTRLGTPALQKTKKIFEKGKDVCRDSTLGTRGGFLSYINVKEGKNRGIYLDPIDFG